MTRLCLALWLLGPAPSSSTAREAEEDGGQTSPAEQADQAEQGRAVTGPKAVSSPSPAPAPPESAEPEETLRVSAGAGEQGPPFYDEQDSARFRSRFGLDPDPLERERHARWRCLIADPTCGLTIELNATSAYAYRIRQIGIESPGSIEWHSGRAQYDLWLNIPVLVETHGPFRYTRITLGPKGGVVTSDGGQLWGNFGFATRYWFGRGAFALALEFTSALTFRLREAGQMKRGPVGFSADVGLGVGGFGALVVGGQYDPALAREEVSETLRVPTGGMVFVGFRGNVLWGLPAAAAVATHAATDRLVETPEVQ